MTLKKIIFFCLFATLISNYLEAQKCDTCKLPLMYVISQTGKSRENWFDSHQGKKISASLKKIIYPKIDFEKLIDAITDNGNSLRVYIAKFSDISDSLTPPGFKNKITLIFAPVKKISNNTFDDIGKFYLWNGKKFISIDPDSANKFVLNFQDKELKEVLNKINYEDLNGVSKPLDSGDTKSIFLTHEKLMSFNKELKNCQDKLTHIVIKFASHISVKDTLEEKLDPNIFNTAYNNRMIFNFVMRRKIAVLFHKEYDIESDKKSFKKRYQNTIATLKIENTNKNRDNFIGVVTPVTGYDTGDPCPPEKCAGKTLGHP